jgi:hypothetical protein
MDIDDMALMFHTMITEVEQRFIDKLIAADIPFTKVDLADEVQIQIHKQWLEQEVDTL